MTKGVLFDATLLPHLSEPGFSWLGPGTHVHKSDLEALEKIERVKVESGDVCRVFSAVVCRRPSYTSNRSKLS